MNINACYAQENTESSFPGGSALDVGYTINKELDQNLDTLNKKHIDLIKAIYTYDPNNNLLITAIKEQHESWIKYYKTECNIVGSLAGSYTGGSWPSTYSVFCYKKVVEERTRKISSTLDCIKNSKPRTEVNYSSDMLDYRHECLYQLGMMITDKTTRYNYEMLGE